MFSKVLEYNKLHHILVLAIYWACLIRYLRYNSSCMMINATLIGSSYQLLYQSRTGTWCKFNLFALVLVEIFCVLSRCCRKDLVDYYKNNVTLCVISSDMAFFWKYPIQWKIWIKRLIKPEPSEKYQSELQSRTHFFFFRSGCMELLRRVMICTCMDRRFRYVDVFSIFISDIPKQWCNYTLINKIFRILALK